MQKTRLELDKLAVESFATDADPAARGTVNAHAFTNPRANTCDYTCGSRPPYLCCTG